MRRVRCLSAFKVSGDTPFLMDVNRTWVKQRSKKETPSNFGSLPLQMLLGVFQSVLPRWWNVFDSRWSLVWHNTEEEFILGGRVDHQAKKLFSKNKYYNKGTTKILEHKLKTFFFIINDYYITAKTSISKSISKNKVRKILQLSFLLIIRLKRNVLPKKWNLIFTFYSFYQVIRRLFPAVWWFNLDYDLRLQIIKSLWGRNL